MRVLILFALHFCALSVFAKSINIMLLTGQTDKYHQWEVTSAYIKASLDKHEIFKTDVVLIPELGEKFDHFVPEFSKYDVVVLNMNLPDWSDNAKRDFEKFVIKGGGVVLVHEAGNAFIHWVEYNKMVGLSGWGRSDVYPKWNIFYQLSETKKWGDRNEEHGPYYYWKEGAFIQDYSDGHAGTHGKRVPFIIQVRDSIHPITKGLPEKWLHTNDELYGDLRGSAKNIHVLATAFSEKESGGTGKEEPVLFTIRYGKGRIFHSVLGHTGTDFSESVQDVGFQVTLSRGVEWAATGKVKQDLPKAFPSDSTILLYDLEQLKQ